MPHEICEKCGHDKYWHTFDGCWNSDHEWGYNKGQKELIDALAEQLDFMDVYTETPEEYIVFGYKCLSFLKDIQIKNLKEQEGARKYDEEH